MEMAQGFALFAAIGADVVGACAKEAEALGYTSFWVNHPGPTDGLAALARAAAETQRVALGVGVVPLHTRGPESIVQGVRDTRLPLDRLLLGVGSPNPRSLERMGVKPIETAIAADAPAAVRPALEQWRGAVDEVVLRAVTANDTMDESLALVRAAKPV